MTMDDRSLDDRELKDALKMYGLDDKKGTYTKNDVNKVYRKLAWKYHPDRPENLTDPETQAESTAKFQKVGKFKEILEKYFDIRDTRTTLSTHDDDIETLERTVRNRDAYMRALEDYIELLKKYNEWQEEQEKRRARNKRQWEDLQHRIKESRMRQLQREAWFQRKREEDRRQREADRQRFVAQAARARARAEAEREDEERRRFKREAAQARARADSERGDEWIYQTGVPGPRNPRPGVDFNYVHAPPSSTANRRSSEAHDRLFRHVPPPPRTNAVPERGYDQRRRRGRQQVTSSASTTIVESYPDGEYHETVYTNSPAEYNCDDCYYNHSHRGHNRSRNQASNQFSSSFHFYYD